MDICKTTLQKNNCRRKVLHVLFFSKSKNIDMAIIPTEYYPPIYVNNSPHF